SPELCWGRTPRPTPLPARRLPAAQQRTSPALTAEKRSGHGDPNRHPARPSRDRRGVRGEDRGAARASQRRRHGRLARDPRRRQGPHCPRSRREGRLRGDLLRGAPPRRLPRLTPACLRARTPPGTTRPPTSTAPPPWTPPRTPQAPLRRRGDATG